MTKVENSLCISYLAVINSGLFFMLPSCVCLWPHGLQHARPPCPSLPPGVCPSSCPLHGWCHPAIWFSDVLFCPQSFPASDFSSELAVHVRWPEYWSFHHQSFQWIFRVDFLLRLTGLISLLSKGLWGVFPSTTVRRHQFFGALPSLWSSSHNCMWPLGRPEP